jgi:hypothetical protein
MLADVLAGESPAGGTRPVTTVVISGSEKGDRLAGSPEVKVPVGLSRLRTARVGSARGASNSVGCSASEPYSPEMGSPPEADGGGIGSAEPLREGRRPMPSTNNWVHAVGGVPGVIEGDMPRKSGQRKHGTSHGTPRPTGTAGASRITGPAGKSRRARERGGWGRLSDDGPGQNNPDRSEGPWGKSVSALERRCMTEHGTPTLIGANLMPRSARRANANGYDASAERRKRKAPLEMPALKPYWGKPAVRNFRGDEGNVGIIEARLAPSSHPT